MGWEALGHWGTDAERIERLTGGVANDVWSVRIAGAVHVARLGRRSDADLAWEVDLLHHLLDNGLTPPRPVPTRDGRFFADGLMVVTFVPGGPPTMRADWMRVASTLRDLHALTRHWPQRPGWRSSLDLTRIDTGTRVDLSRMPHEAVARCRAAWARLAHREPCVVHGNPANPGNVRVSGNRISLIDWDEARVDVPDLDLVLPLDAAGLGAGAHDVAAQAAAAWEAAVCWESAYATRRLAEVRPPHA